MENIDWTRLFNRPNQNFLTLLFCLVFNLQRSRVKFLHTGHLISYLGRWLRACGRAGWRGGRGQAQRAWQSAAGAGNCSERGLARRTWASGKSKLIYSCGQVPCWKFRIGELGFRVEDSLPTFGRFAFSSRFGQGFACQHHVWWIR